MSRLKGDLRLLTKKRKGQGGKFLLITLDSLRADHTTWHGYERETSPRLREFSRRSFVFTNCFAAGPSTITCFKGLLSSTYPLERADGYYLSKERPSIAEILRNSGIKTAAVTSNAFLSSHYGWNRGFETFIDYSHPSLGSSPVNSLDFRQRLRRRLESIRKFFPMIEAAARTLDRYRLVRKGLSPYPDANLIRKRALDWLKEKGREDFFLWIHFNEPHSPYIPPKPYRSLFTCGHLSNMRIAGLISKLERGQHRVTEDEMEILKAFYDSQVRFVDEQIGNLLDELAGRKLLDETMVIVTSDHGEEFREHGEIGHGHMGARPKLYDEIIHVPLLIKFPGQSEGLRIDSLVSHLDIAPTILEFLGSEMEGYRGAGLGALLSHERERFDDRGIFSEFEINGKWVIAYRTRRYKYIHDERSGDELYDLHSDPVERENQIEKAEPAQELREAVHRHKEWIREVRLTSCESPEVPEEKEELKARLRDLGYID